MTTNEDDIIGGADRQLKTISTSLGMMRPYLDYHSRSQERIIIAPSECNTCRHTFPSISNYHWPSESKEPDVYIMMCLAAGIPTLPDEDNYVRHTCCRLCIMSTPEEPARISFKSPVFYFSKNTRDLPPADLHALVTERLTIYPKEIYSLTPSATLSEYARLLCVPYVEGVVPNGEVYEIYELDLS